MIEIQLSKNPNQTQTTAQNRQQCRINLHTQMDGNLYFDLLVAGVPFVQYVICQNKTLLVGRSYLGFIGDFYFVDTQGDSDPTYDGLGARFKLFYLSASEAAAL
jgi:hypothetical protein